MLRGHSDTIILSLLKEKDSYGYELNLSITKRSDDKFILTEATMYTTLKRLEKNGYVESYWQEGINRKRKYYKITETGLDYLDLKIKEWEIGKQIINNFLGGNNGKENKWLCKLYV